LLSIADGVKLNWQSSWKYTIIFSFVNKFAGAHNVAGIEVQGAFILLYSKNALTSRSLPLPGYSYGNQPIA
jgi:hypothetical protein